MPRNPSIQTQVFTDKSDAELFARLLRGKGRKVVLRSSRGLYRVKWVSPHDRIKRSKKNRRSQSNPKRLLPARIAVNPRTGKVRIFVSPKVARAVNPRREPRVRKAKGPKSKVTGHAGYEVVFPDKTVNWYPSRLMAYEAVQRFKERRTA